MEWNTILAFIEEIEPLKSVLRTAWAKSGRQESTAEHSFRLALFALVSMPKFPELNQEKVILLCLTHDLGELYEGDISAPLKPDAEKKSQIETLAMERMCKLLPQEQSNLIMDLWKEYENCATPEAQFVRALDKAETILQHNQGKNPKDFDYSFNLGYGKKLFKDPRMQELRQLLDEKTEARRTAYIP